MQNKHLYLLGYMGSGKSHLGQQLARRLQRPFLDLDAHIEVLEGQTIAAIFERQGEAHFRAAEAAALRATADTPPSVVALGGGTPIYHDNMVWLLSHGTTVFLDPPIAVLVQRLSGATNDRPLLAGTAKAALREQVAAMLAERRPIYEQAQYHIRASEEQAAAVLAALGWDGPQGPK